MQTPHKRRNSVQHPGLFKPHTAERVFIGNDSCSSPMTSNKGSDEREDDGERSEDAEIFDGAKFSVVDALAHAMNALYNPSTYTEPTEVRGIFRSKRNSTAFSRPGGAFNNHTIRTKMISNWRQQRDKAATAHLNWTNDRDMTTLQPVLEETITVTTRRSELFSSRLNSTLLFAVATVGSFCTTLPILLQAQQTVVPSTL